MLKIKNNVDLKELENFGFKPKYDEDTGKIKKFINKDKKYNYTDSTEYILIEIYKELCPYGQYEVKEIWKVYLKERTSESIDLLYDLIQAGLVEKVEK